MQCPHCGEENPAGFRVCGFCARPLASTAARPETRKLVTLVFADVSGSTALGEQFDAEVVRRVMLEFFELAREVLERHGGMVEKFVGDAVMAAFGIPRVHEDDALRAVRAAADLRDRLREFGREVEQRYGTPFGVRIGVNTGEVVAGEAASAQAFASGDAVNLTARLEQAAPPGEVLLGESTVRLLRGAVAVAAVEPLALKGKSQPVPAWRLIDVRPGEMGATRRQDAPLIGRDDELAVLLAAWDTALRDPAVQLVTVVAPAGTGKTRLTMELAEWLRGDAQVLDRLLPAVRRRHHVLADCGGRATGGRGGRRRPARRCAQQARAAHAARGRGRAICAQLEPALGLSDRVVSIEETFWSVRDLPRDAREPEPAARRARRPSLGRGGAARSHRLPRLPGGRRSAAARLRNAPRSARAARPARWCAEPTLRRSCSSPWARTSRASSCASSWAGATCRATSRSGFSRPPPAIRSSSRSSSGCSSTRVLSCVGMGPGGPRPTFASLRCRRRFRRCSPRVSISSTTASAMSRSEPPWSDRSSPEPPSASSATSRPA